MCTLKIIAQLNKYTLENHSKRAMQSKWNANSMKRWIKNERRRRQQRSNVCYILIVLHRVNNTANEWYLHRNGKCEWMQINVLDKRVNVTSVVVPFPFDTEIIHLSENKQNKRAQLFTAQIVSFKSNRSRKWQWTVIYRFVFSHFHGFHLRAFCSPWLSNKLD